MTEEEFRLLRELIRAHCGIWFRDDTRELVQRRLAPRLQLHGLAAFADYHRYLRFDPRGPAELEEATDLLTTNETYFHREPAQLRAFQQEIMPALAGPGPGPGPAARLRVLSAGCATGEEAYTIAILLEASGLFTGWDLDVVGLDISRRCLERARAGAYGEHAFRSPEADRMRCWFHLREGKWVIAPAVRQLVRFVRGNLLDGRGLAAVGTVDVVFCRNVMIYFDLEARRRALRQLHRLLRPGGWLLLGHSESLLNVTADFELVHLTDDLVYRRPAGAAWKVP